MFEVNSKQVGKICLCQISLTVLAILASIHVTISYFQLLDYSEVEFIPSSQRLKYKEVLKPEFETSLVENATTSKSTAAYPLSPLPPTPSPLPLTFLPRVQSNESI